MGGGPGQRCWSIIGTWSLPHMSCSAGGTRAEVAEEQVELEFPGLGQGGQPGMATGCVSTWARSAQEWM